jgi:hypothetical protein
VEQFIHLTAPEMGHGLIAVIVLAAGLPVLISAQILLSLTLRMAHARLDRMRRRRTARQACRVDARSENLASQRAG